MTIGNVASDGYGLNPIEVANLPTQGYAAGIPLIIIPPPVVIICIGDKRDPFYGLYRDPTSEQRYAVYGERTRVTVSSRSLVLVSDREPSRYGMRTPGTEERVPISVSRGRVTGDRTPVTGDRVPTSATRQPPANDVDC